VSTINQPHGNEEAGDDVPESSLPHGVDPSSGRRAARRYRIARLAAAVMIAQKQEQQQQTNTGQ
jgi:hypothetical protein